MNARMSMVAFLWLALVAGQATTTLAAAPSAGPAVEVAPKVENTRMQKWPGAAWAAEANCWLLVWREGDVTEQDSDIWCARVSADGKALDPAGIRVTKAKGLQDKPVVASDGKGFLVAWNDLRNGKDWDVYAARVAGDGKVLDPDGILLAGGEHNQCQPAAAFAGGQYLVTWQSFVPDVMASKGPGKFGSYEVRGARVSPEGKVLDAGGNVLAAVTALQPALVSDGNGGAWLAWLGRADKGAYYLQNGPGVLRIDAAKGTPQGSVAYLPLEQSVVAGQGNSGSFAPSLAWVKDQGGILAVSSYRGGTQLFCLDKDGRKTKAGTKFAYRGDGMSDIFFAYSLAAGGEQILFIQDFPRRPAQRGEPLHLEIRGRILSADGKVLEGGADGFVIAAEPGKDQLQGFACAGPKGTFLVAYAEPRGADDVKVLARIVK